MSCETVQLLCSIDSMFGCQVAEEQMIVGMCDLPKKVIETPKIQYVFLC